MPEFLLKCSACQTPLTFYQQDVPRDQQQPAASPPGTLKCSVTHQSHISQDKGHQASTYPIFFLLELNNLMDWRRRKDILDSKMPSSFKTSSLLRPAGESFTDMLSAGLLSLLIYRRETTKNHFTEFHLFKHRQWARKPLLEVSWLLHVLPKLAARDTHTSARAASNSWLRHQERYSHWLR